MSEFQRTARWVFAISAALFASMTLSGCLVIGASNRGGWFIWPRGFGLLFVFAILLILLLRRRR